MPLVRVRDTELFCDLSGPPGAPVVAFSNSIGTTLEMWDAQARALGVRYRVLRYDTRGHGRSPVTEAPVTIDDLADDLTGLVDALGFDRIHLVGLSLGGMTAQAFAVRHAAKLTSLTLMATAAHLPPAESWNERAATVREKGMGAIVDAVMPRWFTPAFIASGAAEIETTRRHFLANDPRGYALCCEAIRDMDLRPSLARIATPTLIIAGADDPATPVAMSEELRAGIPDAELLVLPRAAHLLAVERADAVSGHLEAFLGRFEDEAVHPVRGASFDEGLINRKRVLGEAHVESSLRRAGEFAMPWQDFITRYAWGEVWGDRTLPWKTRSMLTLAMMISLNREEEFKLHLRPALRNGVTGEELRALTKQAAVYAGVPAANAAFRWIRDVLGDELA